MRVVTLVRCDNGLPFAFRVEMIANPEDGSVSFAVLDGPTAGQFVGQEPWEIDHNTGQPLNQHYGVRYPDSPVKGAYQRATLDGKTVTFQTRNQDIPCGYMIFTGQVY